MLVEDMPKVRRLAHRLGRHWAWGRGQGFDRLAEEDGLHPVDRLRQRWARHRWVRAHGDATGTAVPVWVVGVQRSGTNMLVRGFEGRPDVRVRNENDRRAFDRYRLRDDHVIRSMLDACPTPFLMLKPLCDSHRLDELLDLTPPERGARAIWLFRDVDDRARSAVAKFGAVNRDVLATIAAQGGAGRWQAERMSDETLGLLRSIDVRALTPESGAALFWYVRNVLFFEQGYDRRPDVLPVSYDALVRDPSEVMAAVCRFVGYPFDPTLVAHVDRRAVGPRPPVDLHAIVRARCDELTARLREATERRGLACPAVR